MAIKYWVGYAGLPGREIKYVPDRKPDRYTTSGPIYFKIGEKYEKCGIIELEGFDAEVKKEYYLQVQKYKKGSPKRLIVLVKYHTKEQKSDVLEAKLKSIQIPRLAKLRKKKGKTGAEMRRSTSSDSHQQHTVELGKRRRAPIIRFSDNGNAIVELDGREINLGRLNCTVGDVVEFIELSKITGACLQREVWSDGYPNYMEQMVSGKLPSLPEADNNFVSIDDSKDVVSDSSIELGETQERQKRAQQATVRAEKHRNDVFDTYGTACIVCGYQVATSGGLFGCEAIHIRSVEHNGIDGPQNGLPMCRNDHWLFDKGILSIDDHYRLIVDNSKLESSSINIESYHGQPLQFPDKVETRPALNHVQYHRDEHNIRYDG